jgi:hypothetical protein
MGPVSNGIGNVRGIELPGGIWADGVFVATPRAALVRWQSNLSGKFHQVYINGQYAGVTVESQQRQMIVAIPISPESPVRIEVFAVKAEEADIDFSDELDTSPTGSGRVRIEMLRSQNLPLGTHSLIYFDNGTGEIDYEVPLTASPIRIWPSWQDKAGFGMSRFGASDFGYESGAGVGFGQGSFGSGQFGLDADMLEWVSPPLRAGAYRFTVKASDEAGNESDFSETDSITVTPAARPAEHVSIYSFDKETNELVLSAS